MLEHHKWTWSCSCSDGEYISLSIWDDDPDGPEAYFLFSHYGQPNGLWKRIKRAWRALRAEPVVWGEITLEPRDARQMLDALREIVAIQNTQAVTMERQRHERLTTHASSAVPLVWSDET